MIKTATIACAVLALILSAIYYLAQGLQPQAIVPVLLSGMAISVSLSGKHPRSALVMSVTALLTIVAYEVLDLCPLGIIR
jgi:hypothetical protein